MVNVTTFVQASGALPRVHGGIGVQTSNVVDIGGYTAADTFALFTIPALSKPISCILKIVEDSGETCTLDIGISGVDVDGLMDGVDMNQAAGTIVSGSGDDMPLAAEVAADTLITALAVTGSTYAAGKFQVTLVYACAGVS